MTEDYIFLIKVIPYLKMDRHVGIVYCLRLASLEANLWACSGLAYSLLVTWLWRSYLSFHNYKLGMNAYHIGLMWELNESLYIKDFAYCLRESCWALIVYQTAVELQYVEQTKMELLWFRQEWGLKYYSLVTIPPTAPLAPLIQPIFFNIHQVPCKKIKFPS